MSRSKRDETNEDLAAVVADLRSVVSRLEATVAELKETVAARDLDEAGRGEVVEDLVERIELLDPDAQGHDECRKLVAHLQREADALFSFLAIPDIDATNWRAEQAIRPAVVNRKVWGGNRTWRGAATQGRIMSVLRTAAQQGVDEVDYLAGLARAPTPKAMPSLFT